jgi:hypothetical protein
MPVAMIPCIKDNMKRETLGQSSRFERQFQRGFLEFMWRQLPNVLMLWQCLAVPAVLKLHGVQSVRGGY